jgi:hypothetical protein
MSLVKERWFAKDGSVFSEVSKKQVVLGFKDAKAFYNNESVALNVGNAVAKHMVDLHNNWLDSQRMWDSPPVAEKD